MFFAFSIDNCMFFLMKGDIQPRWEDPQNRRGGCFSYKINHVNTHCIDVFFNIMSKYK